MVSQEEQLRGSDRVVEQRGEAVAFVAQSMGGKGRRTEIDKNQVCTYCSKSGHDADSCYRKNGFPDWWVEKYGRGALGAGRGQNSGRGRGSNVRANVVAVASNSGNPSIIEFLMLANSTEAGRCDGDG